MASSGHYSSGQEKGNCPFCGAAEVRHFGRCSVCDHSVCEKCGNVQYSGGERKVTHRECLHRDEDGFKMIKFVR